MKNYFVRNIPVSHYSHQAFAKTIDAQIIYPAPITKPAILIFLYNIIRVSLSFWKYDKKGTFVCEGFLGLYFAAILKLFLPKINIIYHDADPLFYRDYPTFKGVKKKFVDFFLNKIDYAITDSQISKKHLSKYVHLKKPAKIVYPFTKAEELLFNTNLNRDAIIYVGRFDDEKNLYNLIKALKIVLEEIKNTKLYIVGEGRQKSALLKFAREHGVEKRIIFTGYLSNFSNYLKKSLIGYNVSKFEPFGCNGIEYAAAGVFPLLGTKNGNAEVLNEKKIICNPDDYKDIANKMLSLFNMTNKEKLKLLRILQKKASIITKKKQCKQFKDAFDELTKQ